MPVDPGRATSGLMHRNKECQQIRDINRDLAYIDDIQLDHDRGRLPVPRATISRNGKPAVSFGASAIISLKTQSAAKQPMPAPALDLAPASVEDIIFL